MRRAVHLAIAISAMMAFVLPPTATQAASLELVRIYKVEGNFIGEDKEDDKAATDLSGFACTALPAQHCLAINDQNRAAQFATIEDGRIKVGDDVKLLGKKAKSVDFGSVPDDDECSDGEGKFKDLDGEGVAYAEPYFYIVGSHGCSRKKSKFNASAFVLVRLRVNKHGEPVDKNDTVLPDHKAKKAVETTFRLSEHLRKAPDLADHFAQDLDKHSDGLNIEGIAVIDKYLYVGLRAPSLDENAVIVRVEADDLFRNGPMSPATVIRLPLGKNVGIRDMAALPDRRLVVLSGPTLEQKTVMYRLYVAEPRTGGTLIDLGPIDSAGAKAESVTVLGVEGDKVRLLLMYDGPDNGAPREYLAVIE